MTSENKLEYKFTKKGIYGVVISEVILSSILVAFLGLIFYSINQTGGITTNEGIYGYLDTIFMSVLILFVTGAMVIILLKANRLKALVGQPYFSIKDGYLETYDMKEKHFRIKLSQIISVEACRQSHTLFRHLNRGIIGLILNCIPFGKTSYITIQTESNERPEYLDKEVQAKFEAALNKKGMLANYAQSLQDSGAMPGAILQLLPLEFSGEVKIKQLLSTLETEINKADDSEVTENTVA